MKVRVYDRRSLSSRWIDAPFPLAAELTLSIWIADLADRVARSRVEEDGYWQHDVYRRTGPEEYAFIGTAPDRNGEPAPVTQLWIDREEESPNDRTCRYCHARL